MRIEEEMEGLNILHTKIINEITASFEEQRIKLNRKEKQLKLELDEKVKKIKEELGIFLIESNKVIIYYILLIKIKKYINICDLILFCERTNQAIENYEKKNNKKEIETLYYISEININNEKTKEFLIKAIKNIDISFNSDLNTLEYKDYYFIGIPIPKNIKNEIQGRNVIITWDIDIFKLRELDTKNIKYLLEIKNGNKVYSKETVDKKIYLDISKLNNNYDIKIRAFIDDIYGNWSEIKSFKNNQQNFGLFNNNMGEQNNKNENPFFR